MFFENILIDLINVYPLSWHLLASFSASSFGMAIFYFSHPVTPSSGRNIRFQKSKKCFFFEVEDLKKQKMWGGFFGIGENDELPHFSVSSPRRNLSPSRFPKFITFNPSTILEKPLKILKTRIKLFFTSNFLQKWNFHSKIKKNAHLYL